MSRGQNLPSDAVRADGVSVVHAVAVLVVLGAIHRVLNPAKSAVWIEVKHHSVVTHNAVEASPRSRRPKRPSTSIQQSTVVDLDSRRPSTVDTSIPFSAQCFEYSTECSTYIPCRQTATWLADGRLRGL
eukprot:1195538-Prorocentrum_minimum.AAC.3